MSSLWRKLTVGALGVAVAALAVAAGPGGDGDGRGVPYPATEVAKGDSCVRDTDFMRRNHMDLLKHERAEVVREGVRGGDFSLEKCQECHVSREESCDRCHSYAAVRPDCWGCHDYPREGPAPADEPHGDDRMADAHDLETTLKQWAGGR